MLASAFPQLQGLLVKATCSQIPKGSMAFQNPRANYFNTESILQDFSHEKKLKL